VSDAVGVPPVDVVLVRPGTLPKTSSGKLQRSLCRDRYHADELEPV
jgi:fatty-acyl-CoA synthase